MKMLPEKPFNLWRRRDCARFKISKNEKTKKIANQTRPFVERLFVFSKKIFSQNFLGFFCTCVGAEVNTITSINL